MLSKFQEKLDDVSDMLREARRKIKESDNLSGINQHNMTALEVLKLLILPNKCPLLMYFSLSIKYTKTANFFFSSCLLKTKHCISCIIYYTLRVVVIIANKCPSLTASSQFCFNYGIYFVLYINKHPTK